MVVYQRVCGFYSYLILYAVWQTSIAIENCLLTLDFLIQDGDFDSMVSYQGYLAISQLCHIEYLLVNYQTNGISTVDFPIQDGDFRYLWQFTRGYLAIFKASSYCIPSGKRTQLPEKKLLKVDFRINMVILHTYGSLTEGAWLFHSYLYCIPSAKLTYLLKMAC